MPTLNSELWTIGMQVRNQFNHTEVDVSQATINGDPNSNDAMHGPALHANGKHLAQS